MARLSEVTSSLNNPHGAKDESKRQAKDREWMRELMRNNRQLALDNKAKAIAIRSLNDEIAILKQQYHAATQEVLTLRLKMEKQPSQDGLRKVSSSLRQQVESLQQVLSDLEMAREPVSRASELAAEEPVGEELQTPAPRRAEKARIQDEQLGLPAIPEDEEADPRLSDSPGTPPVISLDVEELIMSWEKQLEPEESWTPEESQTRDQNCTPEQGHMREERQMPEVNTANLETRRRRRHRDRTPDPCKKLDIDETPVLGSPPRDTPPRTEPVKGQKVSDVPKDTEELAIPKARRQSGPNRAGSKRKITILENDNKTIPGTDATPQPPLMPTKDRIYITVHQPRARQRPALARKSTNGIIAAHEDQLAEDHAAKGGSARAQTVNDKAVKGEATPDSERKAPVLMGREVFKDITPALPALLQVVQKPEEDEPLEKEEQSVFQVIQGPHVTRERRSRPSINYAEPSLVTKMRRNDFV